MSAPQHWSQRPQHNTALRIITSFWRKPIQSSGSSCPPFTKLNYVKLHSDSYRNHHPLCSLYSVDCNFSRCYSSETDQSPDEVGTLMSPAIVLRIDPAPQRPSKHARRLSRANEIRTFPPPVPDVAQLTETFSEPRRFLKRAICDRGVGLSMKQNFIF